MFLHWILLLLLTPGWLLPSGVRVPLCGCQFAPSAERSCCAPVERHSCCSGGDETKTTETSVQGGGECHCSVDAPTREPARAQQPAEALVLFAVPFEPVRFSFAVPGSSTARALRPNRPRGPSPGRPNPAPLRL